MGPKIQILVLQRGWVVVGEVHKEGADVVVSGASVIRRWGTTKGLGEIASGGPTGATCLDPAGTVRVHELAVVMAIDCDAEKWKGHVCSQQ